jgi:hypothetical protein
LEPGTSQQKMVRIGVGGGLLTRLLFFIRIAEDDNVVVAGWLEQTVVEVVKESSSEFLMPRCIREGVVLLIRSKIHH